MRLIDADVFEVNLINAIMLMKNMAKAIGLEDDPAIQAEIKAYQDILNGMKEQPTIEPKRNKGLWHWADGMYSCDQCGEILDEKSPFCPMCGADMRGEQDG